MLSKLETAIPSAASLPEASVVGSATGSTDCIVLDDYCPRARRCFSDDMCLFRLYLLSSRLVPFSNPGKIFTMVSCLLKTRSVQLLKTKLPIGEAVLDVRCSTLAWGPFQCREDCLEAVV